MKIYRKKTKEAEDNLTEANIQKALAEHNQAEAETQRETAEKNQAEAETQRGIAEENLALLTASNNELLIRAASSAASNAKTLFSKGDRIGAIKTALSVRPYTEDETKLLPITRKVLASALYAYNTSSDLVIDRTIEADASIEIYRYNAEGSVIYAYDSNNTIYIWSAETGETLFKKTLDESISALYSLEDEYLFCVVTDKNITAFSLTEGSAIWSRDNNYNDVFISDDGSVLVMVEETHTVYDDDISNYDILFSADSEKKAPRQLVYSKFYRYKIRKCNI
ncbi:MAG: PQQ-binding-like beta-propeller repeat protein [Clostridiales bacterium]|nr:PQQ-binding-like beta-propeller repeat protein [Clostridiales bacterium]